MLMTLTPDQIIQSLEGRFPNVIQAAYPEDKHPRIHVAAADTRIILEFLRHDPALQMDWLRCLSAVDYVADNQLSVVYDLYSFTHRHMFAIKAYCDRADPSLPSVVDLWPAANWHEREAFDLLGITFTGHPDLRRILCADDWIGHPLRKDYTFPQEYHGIPANLNLPWQHKPKSAK
ncbi:MAG TPA: NADH-quinone oxidoreductase subunit C [Tepidisphaeraceae bacterium]|jgi:NADH-quinone oxidoreductase subunit C|nr:NADH-quinone oxidoreductase subunit C [Tepidisphaeraceae bacterium]